MITLSARCLKGFADGFGGGILGGLAYWKLASLLGNSGVPFPSFKVASLAIVLGFFEAWRVSRRIHPLRLLKIK
ncbi:MAG TPA: hypothetical protein VM120_05150 [Bryobacteraceae bacterium]|nr:hypothetical protein [Bryobacteraceae bacterium]